MNDLIPGTRVEGAVQIDGVNIYDPSLDVVGLRRRVGMVFQKSNPFPKSIFENVAYGLRINGLAKNKAELNERVEEQPAVGGAVGRGEGSAARTRAGALGRAAAAAVHRAGAGGEARRCC